MRTNLALPCPFCLLPRTLILLDVAACSRHRPGTGVRAVGVLPNTAKAAEARSARAGWCCLRNLNSAYVCFRAVLIPPHDHALLKAAIALLLLPQLPFVFFLFPFLFP